MRLWIDDVRKPPIDAGWTWCKTSKHALDCISIGMGYARLKEEIPYYIISFDHDLGENDTTIPIAKYFEELAYNGVDFKLEWTIHSANPVGKANLQRILESMERFQHEKTGDRGSNPL